MGTISDIGALATEKAANRRAWGKAIIGAVLSSVVSIVGTTWKVRGYIDELERKAEKQEESVKYLKDHLPVVEQIAIDARADAQHTEKMLMAHLGGYLQPNSVK